MNMRGKQFETAAGHIKQWQAATAEANDGKRKRLLNMKTGCCRFSRSQIFIAGISETGLRSFHAVCRQGENGPLLRAPFRQLMCYWTSLLVTEV